MGGGNPGSAAPQSSEGAQPPAFLQEHVSKGKYNIGIAGYSGVGKSSLLNEILGGNAAVTGEVESTDVPSGYDLPLLDPRGLFHKFMAKLPKIHQDCMASKLESVKLWDLPGCGTQRHPSETYATAKGLRFFDFVVLIVGNRILESDIEFITCLEQSGVKHFVVRSKLDCLLRDHLAKQRKLAAVSLRYEQKELFSIHEMDRVRSLMIEQVKQAVPNFKGHLYLTSSISWVDDEDPMFKLVSELNEMQSAFDWLLLDVIRDRHGHDLAKYFDESTYGKASRVVFSWLEEAFALQPAGVQRFILQGAPGISAAVASVAAGYQGIAEARESLTSSALLSDVSAVDAIPLVERNMANDIMADGVAPISGLSMQLDQGSTDLQAGGDLLPDDSASQVPPPQCHHLPEADMANSIVTERGHEVESVISDGFTKVSDIALQSEASWTSCGVGEEPRCFLPETLFPMFDEHGTRCFLAARHLQKGSRVLAADQISYLEVLAVESRTHTSIVFLKTVDASLAVSPSHRVVVPREQEASKPCWKFAENLEEGDFVVCKQCVQQLTNVEIWTFLGEPLDVLAITFKPDIPVAAFESHQAILTLGQKPKQKTRRSRMNVRGNGSGHTQEPEHSSMPSTAGMTR